MLDAYSRSSHSHLEGGDHDLQERIYKHAVTSWLKIAVSPPLEGSVNDTTCLIKRSHTKRHMCSFPRDWEHVQATYDLTVSWQAFRNVECPGATYRPQLRAESLRVSSACRLRKCAVKTQTLQFEAELFSPKEQYPMNCFLPSKQPTIGGAF